MTAAPYESSSIIVAWTPLPPLDWNSASIGYRILYKIYPSNDSSFTTVDVALSEAAADGRMEKVITKMARFVKCRQKKSGDGGGD